MKKALIFRGGWEGHEPVQTSDIVADSLRARGLDVEVCFRGIWKTNMTLLYLFGLWGI